MRRILAIILCIGMLMCVACSNEQKDNSSIKLDTEIGASGVIELTQEENDSIALAVTDFSIRMLQTEENESSNRLLSPFSVLTAMSMLANGAKSETKVQIEDTLGLPVGKLNLFISQYREKLTEEKENCFQMANSIWFTKDKRFTVNEAFLQTNREYYGADVFEEAFDQATVSQINEWVEENTDGMIQEILDAIPADAVMYLINTLVFDAKWEETYEESDIDKDVFTTKDGILQQVPFMYSTENMYLEDSDAIGFIKYYKGRDYAFVALLPNEDITLSEYIGSLSGSSVYHLLQNAQEVKTHVWLPQFEVTYQTELKKTLQNMGITDVFDAKLADLSALGSSTQGNLYVDRVIHKTYIEVSPVGTKAGAATIIEVKNECAMIEPPDVKEVRLNRPFLYMIIDCEYNQPIFIGSVGYIDVSRCGYPTEEEFTTE